MKPTVGRVVHYVARGSADGVYPRIDRAAVITEGVSDDTVTLCVLNPTGIFFGNSRYREAREPGSRHWPEREG